MTFRDDVGRTPGLEDAHREGLQALKRADRRHVEAKERGRLDGSIDLDEHLTLLHPQAPVWDYCVAVGRGSRGQLLHWIEVHPAGGDGKITEVIGKKGWLDSWLLGDGRRLGEYDRRFVWVATGRVTVLKRSRGARRLAKAGISLQGRHYTVC